MYEEAYESFESFLKNKKKILRKKKPEKTFGHTVGLYAKLLEDTMENLLARMYVRTKKTLSSIKNVS